jgi:hypothetical protein
MRLINVILTNAIVPDANRFEVKIMALFDPVIKLNNAERLKIPTTGIPDLNSKGKN